MTSFIEQYDQLKIPEWYKSYVDYKKMTKKLNDFQELIDQSKCSKLAGIYYLSGQLQKPICITISMEQDPVLVQKTKLKSFMST